MPEFPTLKLSTPQEHVLQVTLNRPEVANAMNTQMGLDLMHCFEDIALDPADHKTILGMKAFQYDIVCNGVELSSGAIRNHRPDIMKKAFALAGYGEDVLLEKFGGDSLGELLGHQELAGGEPANFLDVGGGANVETVKNGFRIILEDPSVKAILINIFGGIVRCDRIANGIIEAAKNVNINVPLIVRLAGTNAEEAKEILLKSGIRLDVADGLKDGAEKVVKAIRKN